jgi:hypothetical protein
MKYEAPHCATSSILLFLHPSLVQILLNRYDPELNSLYNRAGKISSFGNSPRRILKVIQRFGRHFRCHFQGEISKEP